MKSGINDQNIKVSGCTSQIQRRVIWKSVGLSASMGCGSEHVACEPEVEVSLTARGTANEGSGQFRMGVRSGLHFTNFV
jgi:hypothetical protein